jgi:hypothetical protein
MGQSENSFLRNSGCSQQVEGELNGVAGRVSAARVYFGNESPNIGFPLLDCCLVTSP